MRKLYFEIKLVGGKIIILDEDKYNKIKHKGLCFTDLRSWVVYEGEAA